jgi:hypothetical protein
MAAALTLYRFVLLWKLGGAQPRQQAERGRAQDDAASVVAARVDDCGASLMGEASMGQEEEHTPGALPVVYLQPQALSLLLHDSLWPMRACVEHAIDAQRDSMGGISLEEDPIKVSQYMGLHRLHDTLCAVMESMHG